MLSRPWRFAAVAAVIAVSSGCGSAAAPPTSISRPTATSKPTTPSPTATALPALPYAVLVTNTGRQGATYDVVLLDKQARVVARVTARLPLIKPNQTLQLPLVSASSDLVYYLDGDTEIHSLAPSGATVLVKTITTGATSTVAFAVSPDDHRIAVSTISEKADRTKDTGHGYVESVADTSNHLDLFSNTDMDAIRWPAGWHGSQIIDAAGFQCGGYGYSPASAQAPGCPGSYHVINGATGARSATVCETPNPQPTGENVTISLLGLPVPGGVACREYENYFNGTQQPPSDKILAIDWAGHETTFVTGDATGNVPYGTCYLAPAATEMACASNTSQAITLITSSGSVHNLGRRYNVLGWLDDSHLIVDIDSTTLGVLDHSSGAVVNIAFPGADKVEMDATLPGAL